MNETLDNIILNTYGYTPIYVVQDLETTSVNSFFVTPNVTNEAKPENNNTINNLKTFYENSGNLENDFLIQNNTVSNINRITVSNCDKVLTNNKGTTVKNLVFEVPTTFGITNSKVPTVQKVNIVKQKVNRNGQNLLLNSKAVVTKAKPNLETTSSRNQSVKLLKIGQTYHSLDQLNHQEMQIVNKAMMHINKTPNNDCLKPTYDPVTKTRIIYKEISPGDLNVDVNNRIVISEKKKDNRKSEQKCLVDVDEITELPHTLNPAAPKSKLAGKINPSTKEPHKLIIKAVMTRSGRKVKTPKQIFSEEPMVKQKKRVGNLSCFQCSSVFTNIFRLQKHYETHPTHIPTNAHYDLFICLLAIVKSAKIEERAQIFIHQLEHLIERIISLLPCLMKKMNDKDDSSCTINEDIGRLLGINAGKYNLNMDALNCFHDKDGHCIHYPKDNLVNKNPDAKQKTPNYETTDTEDEKCSRIKSVDTWPLVRKRVWNIKPKENKTNKKMKIVTEIEPQIELGSEELNTFSNYGAIDVVQSKTENIVNNSCIVIGEAKENTVGDEETSDIHTESECINSKSKNNHHTQFYSSHFDIRSSPIKPSSSVFHKFQINPQKITDYQNIRPLVLENTHVPVSSDIQSYDNHNFDLQKILEEIKIPHNANNNLNFDSSKSWSIQTADNDGQHKDNFMESSLSDAPSPINNVVTAVDVNLEQNGQLHSNDLSNQEQSVLNFLDELGNECLTYPESEIRSTVDFNDLFTFPNT